MRAAIVYSLTALALTACAGTQGWSTAARPPLSCAKLGEHLDIAMTFYASTITGTYPAPQVVAAQMREARCALPSDYGARIMSASATRELNNQMRRAGSTSDRLDRGVLPLIYFP